MGKYLSVVILICGTSLMTAAAVVAGSPEAAKAEPACTSTQPGVLLGEAIAIVADASVPAGVLDEALAAWRTCPTAAAGFPAFAAAEQGRSEVRVRYVAGSSQDGRCGVFAGSEIVLFRSAYDRTGRVVPCGPPAVNLAHELGHVLGLRDAPRNASCRRLIMAADDPIASGERRVRDEECVAADLHWRTPSEGAVLASVWVRDGGSFLPLDTTVPVARLEPSVQVAQLGAIACIGPRVSPWRVPGDSCGELP